MNAESTLTEAGSKLDAARQAHRKSGTATTQARLDQAAADYRAADRAANLARANASVSGPYSVSI